MVAGPEWQDKQPDINVLFNKRNEEREAFAVVRQVALTEWQEASSPWIKATHLHCLRYNGQKVHFTLK